jgi:GGDEF domain-containing protein
VESPEVRALVRLVNRRFQSFSEATDSVLAALGDVVPGTILLAQVDDDEGRCRVIDMRGTPLGGLERGSTLPLAPPKPTNGNGSSPQTVAECEPDPSFLQSLGGQSTLTAPLELSGGRIAGCLCSLAGEPNAYRAEHAAVLGVGARILSYEWESVQSRAELRRLRGALADGASTDGETGLPNRVRFLDLLDREWRLVDRGLVEAVIVSCHVGPVSADGDQEVAQAAQSLAIKDTAEVMGSTIRTTDHVGRVGENTIASVLVGCNPEGGARFLQRFRSALQRVTQARPEPVGVKCGIQPLVNTSSAAQALTLAETNPAFWEPPAPGSEQVSQEA